MLFSLNCAFTLYTAGMWYCLQNIVCMCPKLTFKQILVFLYYYYNVNLLSLMMPLIYLLTGSVTNTTQYVNCSWRPIALRAINRVTQRFLYYKTMDWLKMYPCVSPCQNRSLNLWILVSSDWSKQFPVTSLAV